MKNMYKKITYLVILSSIFSISSCGSTTASSNVSSQNDSSEEVLSSIVESNSLFEESSEESPYIDDGEVSIHTDHQLSFINSPAFNLKYNSNIAVGTTDWSRPKLLNMKAPITASEGEDYVIRYSDDENFKTYFETPVQGNYFQVTNLKINTKYYYYEYTGNDENKSQTHIFKVKDEAPRNLNIAGVENSRDLGGWKIQGTEKRIKQGVLYRTGAFHDRYTDKITEEGIKTVSEVLKVKSEIDLRSADEAGRTITLIPNGKYYNFPMNYNDGLFVNETNIKSTVKVFKLLSNKNNYPISFHCAIGTDRTGWIAFLINGLLGVSNDDLIRDYMFSNFANIGGGRTKTDIETYISTFAKKYPDSETLSSQIQAFLLENGITQDQINTITNYLIED